MDSDAFDVPLFANHDDADPAVIAAVAEAKTTFPLFLEAASNMRFSPARYLVKVGFIDRSRLRKDAIVRTAETAAENSMFPLYHLWLSVTSVLDDLVCCSIDEAPEALHFQPGMSFVIAMESIEDWMINYNGMVVGGG